MKNYTKKQIAILVKEGKIEELKKHLIFFNKSQLIDALYLMLNSKDNSYNIQFESVPYSKGGKWARHTTTLYSIQSWRVAEYGNGILRVSTSVTSKSAACPSVIVPKFGTAEAIAKHNAIEAKKLEKAAKEKAEMLEKIKAEQKEIKKQKAAQKSEYLKNKAKEHGFSSVAKMKEQQLLNNIENSKRMSRALANRDLTFEKIYGRKCDGFKITDRVALSRIELIFDCEQIKDLY